MKKCIVVFSLMLLMLGGGVTANASVLDYGLIDTVNRITEETGKKNYVMGKVGKIDYIMVSSFNFVFAEHDVGMNTFNSAWGKKGETRTFGINADKTYFEITSTNSYEKRIHGELYISDGPFNIISLDYSLNDLYDLNGKLVFPSAPVISFAEYREKVTAGAIMEMGEKVAVDGGTVLLAGLAILSLVLVAYLLKLLRQFFQS